MNTHVLLSSLIVASAAAGFGCIDNEVVVTIDLDPIEVCWDAHAPGTFSDSTTVDSIKNYVPASYRNGLRQFRIYDFAMQVHNAPSSGAVDGDVFFRFEGGPTYQVLHFQGSYSDFANGISVLRSGEHVTINPDGMNAFLTRLRNPDNLPRMVVRGQGNATGPTQSGNFLVCCVVYFQASALLD